MTGVPSVRGTFRRRRRTQRGEELLQEQQVAAVGHHVALDPQMAHPLHADQALEADGGHRLGELRPGFRRRDKAEGSAGAAPRSNGNALAHRHRNRLVAAQHGERERGQPGAPLQRFVAVEGLARRVNSTMAQLPGLMLASLMTLAHFGMSAAMAARVSSRRAADRVEAKGGELLLHLGIGQHLQQFGAHLVDDGLRRAGRRQQGEPRGRLEAREAQLVQGRQVGRIGRTLERGDADAAHPAVAHQRQAGAGILDADRDHAAHDVGEIGAAIGNVLHLDAGQMAEQLARHVLRRADARRAVATACRDWPWHRRSGRRSTSPAGRC